MSVWATRIWSRSRLIRLHEEMRAFSLNSCHSRVSSELVMSVNFEAGER